ncbi:hypothetical protein PL11201_310028 [Planktothrix sp. PCC 11201]|nr:hypothetical protein PL11201_310028 [Planktothrix sp. PCC 11201]
MLPNSGFIARDCFCDEVQIFQGSVKLLKLMLPIALSQTVVGNDRFQLWTIPRNLIHKLGQISLNF